MTAINAQPVYSVNTQIVNGGVHAGSVGKQAETPPSPFWKRLMRAWDRQGLPTSQNGVAVRLDMSQGSTRRWYTGDGLPEIPHLIEIARRGRVNIHWLLTGEGVEMVNPDADTVALLRFWDALPPESRAAVLRVAKLEHANRAPTDDDPKPNNKRHSHSGPHSAHRPSSQTISRHKRP